MIAKKKIIDTWDPIYVVPGTRPVPELLYLDPPGPDPPYYLPARYPEIHYPDPPGTRVFGTRPITS